MLTVKDYKNAILVQDACNLSGVIHSWDEVIPRIRKDMQSHGDCSTGDINAHPINILFADKVASLTGVQGITDGSMDAYSKAYEFCKDKVDQEGKEI